MAEANVVYIYNTSRNQSRLYNTAHGRTRYGVHQYVIILYRYAFYGNGVIIINECCVSRVAAFVYYYTKNMKREIEFVCLCENSVWYIYINIKYRVH